MSASSSTSSDSKIIAYDQAIPDLPPVQTATPSLPTLVAGLSEDRECTPSCSILTSTFPEDKHGTHPNKDMRRDSGRGPSRDSKTSLNPEEPSSFISHIVAQNTCSDEALTKAKAGDKEGQSAKHLRSKGQGPQTDKKPFRGISLEIPTGTLDGIINGMPEFSKRSSMLIGNQNADKLQDEANNRLRNVQPSRRVRSNPSLHSKSTRVLSLDEELMSRKLRAIYEYGTEDPSLWGERSSSTSRHDAIIEENPPSMEGVSTTSISRATSTSELHNNASAVGFVSKQNPTKSTEREESELAGGLEDWENVKSEEVDRYGFIVPKGPSIKEISSGALSRPPSSLEPQPLQRVTTSLQLASESPRRKRTIRRAPSNAKQTKAADFDRQNSTKSIRPVSSQSSYQGKLAGSNSMLRTATNRLPHNRQRRMVDEAGDMLTLKPSLMRFSQSAKAGEFSDSAAQRKELEREAKWRKMAKKVSANGQGAGTVFDFDTHSNKLIERTWKGIPDSWRATAWHAFLSASARKSKDSVPDEELIGLFNDYQIQSSPDDCQIDLDVPRTVSSHIMFRRRYRGGQRLLFRVLHALSLHFPDTGYVQGMAPLTATFLSYYDEENAFVMLVRLWQLRGLHQLYREGLAGLMEALEDFKTNWLDGGEVAEKLVSEILDTS